MHARYNFMTRYAFVLILIHGNSIFGAAAAAESSPEPSDDESGVYYHMVYRPYEAGEIQLAIHHMSREYGADFESEQGEDEDSDEEEAKEWEEGASVDDEAAQEPTAMQKVLFCARYGDSETMRELLQQPECRSVINGDAENKGAPLFLALYSKNKETASVLIEHGALVDEVMLPGKKVDSVVRLPMLFAPMYRRDPALVALLLNAKADPNVIIGDEDGEKITFLEFAMVSKKSPQRSAIVDLLLNAGARLEMRNGINPLLFAIYRGDAALVQSFITHKSDVNERDNGEDGCTPLMIACGMLCKDDESPREIVTLLLDAKVDVCAVNTQNETALTEACACGADRELVTRLVLAKSDVNAKTRTRKRTPLFNAALSCNVDVVSYLLAQKALVDTVDCNGITPLMMAAGHNTLEVVQALVHAGARLDIKDKRRGGVFIKCILGKDHKPCTAMDYAHTPEIWQFLTTTKIEREAAQQGKKRIWREQVI